MLTLLLASAAALVGTSLFGYVGHRALHSKISGPLGERHMDHHQKLYPPENFYSEDKYRGAGLRSTAVTFAALGLPIVVLPLALS